MGNGWICLHRSLMDHWAYSNPVALKAWIYILLTANHKASKVLFDGDLLTVNKGQFLTSVRKFADKVGCTRRKAENLLELFEKDEMITRQRYKRGTLLTIVNYSVYQDRRDSDDATESTSESTTDSTTDSTQTTNITMNNNDNNESVEPELAPAKIHRHKTGKYENVYLSNDEAAKLMKEYGEVLVSATIESLSEYMKTHKTNYQDDGHYALICKWIREDRKKKPGKEEEEYNARQREAIRKSCEIGIG